ncbi:MAG: FAD-binding oxidoreductase [Maricaulaceae bacterium]
MAQSLLSWGRAHKFPQTVKALDTDGVISLDHLSEQGDNKSLIAHGMGRSYGDVALNKNGTVVKTTRRNRIIKFDREAGTLRAEAGLTLDEVLKISVPAGWFLSVTPGTKYVTLGGAVANDVHGKNHHQAGSFGHYVQKLSLIRSDRSPLICSPKKNKKLFEMTIGGLGLTGIIEWVEIKLKPIKSAYMDVENIPYNTLEDFFTLSAESENWPYTVAWVDCFAPKSKLGRGIFTRANFTNSGALDGHTTDSTLSWPFPTPRFCLNRLSISAFNLFYRIRPGARFKGRMHYNPFFYPLDGINHWNRMYGAKGFYQHQSLIPFSKANAGMAEMLHIIRKSGQGSFLAVMKINGIEKSTGQMSFCKLGHGVSLALDFANKGSKTLALLDALDKCTAKYNGRTYAAKDGRMSAEFFQESYPKWSSLEQMRDPLINSTFWKRVSAQITPNHENISP